MWWLEETSMVQLKYIDEFAMWIISLVNLGRLYLCYEYQ